MIKSRRNGRICLVFGTRPEIIKLSPVIRRLHELRMDYDLIHSDQHNSYRMDKIFFKELELPAPRFRIALDQKTRLNPNRQIARIIDGTDYYLRRLKPSVVIVQGDTNTVLAASLTVNRIAVRKGPNRFMLALAHIEAGLRSRDRGMPEEFNRMVSDQLADYLFAPTRGARKNLIREGIKASNIYVTGNTVVDSVIQNLEISRRKSSVLKRWNLQRHPYALLTLHRPENVDDPTRFRMLAESIQSAHQRLKMPIIFTAHPRTVKKMKIYGIRWPKGVQVKPSVGYLDFLRLMDEAQLIFTDSGGVQEEACVMKIPCITLRDNTERPETVECGGNAIAGTRKKNITYQTIRMMKKNRNWKNPLGNGRSARRIIDIIMKA